MLCCHFCPVCHRPHHTLVVLFPLGTAFKPEVVNRFMKEVIGKAGERDRGRHQIDWRKNPVCARCWFHPSSSYLPPLRARAGGGGLRWNRRRPAKTGSASQGMYSPYFDAFRLRGCPTGLTAVFVPPEDGSGGDGGSDIYELDLVK